MTRKGLGVSCANWPPELTPRAARKRGEGTTWTCTSCGEQFVLTQGKGEHWFWQPIADLIPPTT
jgi:hypothetical protein